VTVTTARASSRRKAEMRKKSFPRAQVACLNAQRILSRISSSSWLQDFVDLGSVKYLVLIADMFPP
jgi:hypothetical protein